MVTIDSFLCREICTFQKRYATASLIFVSIFLLVACVTHSTMPVNAFNVLHTVDTPKLQSTLTAGSGSVGTSRGNGSSSTRFGGRLG